jgi:hypothetical protein
LIVRKKENGTYQRIGLAEIKENDLEKLQKIGKEEELIVKMDEEKTQILLVAQVEQSTK